MEENQNKFQRQAGKPKTKKSIKNMLPIILAILVIIVLILSGIFFIVGRRNNTDKNLSLIFDENKLIPVKINDLYGYISSKDGKIVIEPQYYIANSFYGNYASVSFLDDNYTKYGIIDKSGDIKLSTDTSYNITMLPEYGIFVVDNNLYSLSNKNLKTLNEKNTIIYYENLGYSSYIKSDNDGNNIEGGILDQNGKKVYSYKFKNSESFFSCAIGDTSEVLKEKYAVVCIDNEKYAIINLANGKIVYDYTNKIIAPTDDNIFDIYSEETSNLESTICIFNNKIAYETSEDIFVSFYDYEDKILELDNYSTDTSNRYSYYDLKNKTVLSEKPEFSDKDVLESLTGYYTFSDDQKYGIMKNNKIILPAEYDDIEFLSTTTFNYIKSKKHLELALAEKDNEYQLINLKNNKIIASFDTYFVSTFSASTFVKCKLKNSNETLVYNIVTGKTMNFDKDSTVSVYSNYITVSKDGDITYYNTNFKEIYKM